MQLILTQSFIVVVVFASDFKYVALIHVIIVSLLLKDLLRRALLLLTSQLFLSELTWVDSYVQNPACSTLGCRGHDGRAYFEDVNSLNMIPIQINECEATSPIRHGVCLFCQGFLICGSLRVQFCDAVFVQIDFSFFIWTVADCDILAVVTVIILGFIFLIRRLQKYSTAGIIRKRNILLSTIESAQIVFLLGL